MGLLNILERLLIPAGRGQQKRIELKEIFCKRKDDGYIETFKTAAVGTELSNPDGSDRQAALEKLKVGQKLRLIWDAGESGSKNVVYLLLTRSTYTQELAMPDCFGRLNDKVAADVIRWLNKDNIVTAASVVKIVGGTRKRPKLGCVLELRTYPGPEAKE